jgi:hypothetical protein
MISDASKPIVNFLGFMSETASMIDWDVNAFRSLSITFKGRRKAPQATYFSTFEYLTVHLRQLAR